MVPAAVAACLLLIAMAGAAHATEPTIRTFMADGGWCWFQDPRALIADGRLVVGGVDGRNGDVKVSVYDLAADRDLGTAVLHAGFEADDHDAPALYLRPDGRLLAVYARHAHDRNHYYRISEPGNFLAWGEEKTFAHDYEGGWGVTYMNLFHLEKEGLLYNFFRDGRNINPSFITSSDQGDSWGNRTHFITDELGWQRPYARYQKRGADTVAVSFTDAHPRQYGNNLYYTEFRNGAFYNADGSKVKNLAEGPIKPSEAECIYKGSQTKEKPSGFDSVPNSAWSCAMAVDAKGYPHLGYTVFLSNEDHRYRMASWDGKKWIDREVARAGACLYPAESSYTGLIALDPADPSRVAVSSNVNPSTGDGSETFEIYTATIGPEDDIRSVRWNPVTRRSTLRNIRPIIVAGNGYKVLIWMRGEYKTYTDYDCDAVGMVLERPARQG